MGTFMYLMRHAYLLEQYEEFTVSDLTFDGWGWAGGGIKAT